MVESEDVKKAEIDRLYKEYVSKVYRTANYYVRDHFAAEEITHEVFLKLYDNLGDIQLDAVYWWMLTTAKNMALNYDRDRKREIPVEDVADAESEYHVDGLDEQLVRMLRQKEYRDLVDEIFANLYIRNPRWYEAVSITYILGKPQKEVAESMGVSLEVLHSMLYRAKKWIRESYEEQFHQLNDK